MELYTDKDGYFILWHNNIMSYISGPQSKWTEYGNVIFFNEYKKSFGPLVPITLKYMKLRGIELPEVL